MPAFFSVVREKLVWLIGTPNGGIAGWTAAGLPTGRARDATDESRPSPKRTAR